ncbi:MAG: DUF1361 domain-containing protein [Bacteroidetes bacterium]|nr:DUF1361 domain-containing protein [Bacteroidota bacterium]
MNTIIQFWVQTFQQSGKLILDMLRAPFLIRENHIERTPMYLSYLAGIIWLIRFYWVLSHSPEGLGNLEFGGYPFGYSHAIYLFLPWNLFLAWLPFLISRYMRPDQSGLFFWPLFFLWLLFFPNAPYLITDFIHFGESLGTTFFLELATFSLFAAAGVSLGCYSLLQVHRCLNERFNRHFTKFAILSIWLLSSVGIYIGRRIRFNSWDAFTRPDAVLATFVEYISQPEEAQFFGIFVGVCTLFLLLCYLLAYLPRRKKLKAGSL